MYVFNDQSSSLLSIFVESYSYISYINENKMSSCMYVHPSRKKANCVIELLELTDIQIL